LHLLYNILKFAPCSSNCIVLMVDLALVDG
jgi:hypothetical protein